MHANATFSNNLTEGENQFIQHMTMHGEAGYPVAKCGSRHWSFEKAFGACGSPGVYKTKRQAIGAVDAYLGILRDRIAGRLEPSPGSPAAELPAGWTEATLGGMAASPDPVNGGIVDCEIVSGDWFAISNRPGMPVLEGFKDRAAAFAALKKAHA